MSAQPLSTSEEPHEPQAHVPAPPSKCSALPVRPMPLPNYTLSTVCPACEAATFRLACKVRCARCGFMWDCSEL